jgi:membrane protease subunit HflC
MSTGKFLLIISVFTSFFVLYSSTYIISETEQVIITQLGDPIGDPITEAGLYFKYPFIQEVNRIEKRILEWDGMPNEMPTKDKTYIRVDTFARWRIKDAKQYFLRFRDEPSAQSRLEDILGSETRNAIARQELIEVVRSDPKRGATKTEGQETTGDIYPIKLGRRALERQILSAAKPKLTEVGLDLLDVRFKRINYNPTVQQRIYERMISERQQIADRFRSEGAGEAARIRGKKERDLQRIESEAYRKILELRGQADAKAAEIYARAYNQTPESRSFYSFLKAMETYQKALTSDTKLVLSTDSTLWKFLK